MRLLLLAALFTSSLSFADAYTDRIRARQSQIEAQREQAEEAAEMRRIQNNNEIILNRALQYGNRGRGPIRNLVCLSVWNISPFNSKRDDPNSQETIMWRSSRGYEVPVLYTISHSLGSVLHRATSGPLTTVTIGACTFEVGDLACKVYRYGGRCVKPDGTPAGR